MTTRCALYLRVSLDRTGDHLAVDRQREDCLEIARLRGWTVVGEYVDNSISASNAAKVRPGYERLVSDFDAGAFDALVCWDLDRLTRQPRQLEDWIDAAEERGLRLVTANGEADLGTDGGRMFARVKAAVARSEVERKSARQTRALRQRAERGRLPAGVRLTGYATDGTVDEVEASVVREMFERFLVGDSLKAIAADLERRGIVTRSGRPWNPSSVRTVLLNPRYAGLSVYKGAPVVKDGERVPGAWEPIVTEATYDAVRARLADPARKSNRKGTHRRHLGSGLFLCGECDKPMRTHNSRYRCPDAHLMRSRGQVDDFVLRVVRARLARPDLRDLLASSNDDESASLTAEIEDQRRRLAAIEHDYDEGHIDGRRYAEASGKARARLDAAQARRTALTAGSAASGILDAPDPVAAFDSASLGARRTVIDALLSVRLMRAPVGSRTFNPDSVHIEWRAPSAPSTSTPA
ncbi:MULTISPECIES: recombinase family protein [unclassified Nocardioides]|uniref:recombinase family protein n=1 Tax=unclassified Nocardioides TaxID=2615069 RepID=UPI000056F800|nr:MULTISPECIES: recombinase family protein [unclassified Nocardioides]ABL80607.1 Recombinase [Nocardioides sp. JS614]